MTLQVQAVVLKCCSICVNLYMYSENSPEILKRPKNKCKFTDQITADMKDVTQKFPYPDPI